MNNYNKSGPGHPPANHSAPVAIDVLRIAVEMMDEAHVATVLFPHMEPYYQFCQMQVILIARIMVK